MVEVWQIDQGWGWDDLRVSLLTAKTGNNAPTLATFVGSVQALAFAAAATNEVWFDVQLPHSWVPGSIIEPHLHWSVGSAAGNGTTQKVRWQLEYTWASANEPFPAPTALTAADDTASAVAYTHQLIDLGTIDGAGKRLSSVLMCRLLRAGAAAEDTYPSVAYALSIDFHIRSSAVGSPQEYLGAV